MRIVDIIDKKKKGFELTKEEIDFFISSLVDKSMPDYQAAAWLMAVWHAGMNERETADLTEAIINSGDRIDFGELTEKIVDKHSTGRQYLVENFNAKLASGGREITIRCPFCGDSLKNIKARHMYMGINIWRSVFRPCVQIQCLCGFWRTC